MQIDRSHIEWLNTVINWRGIDITYILMPAKGAHKNGVSIGREGALNMYPYEFIFITITDGIYTIKYEKQIPFKINQCFLETKVIFVRHILYHTKGVDFTDSYHNL
jgi:hypothetical protein